MTMMNTVCITINVGVDKPIESAILFKKRRSGQKLPGGFPAFNASPAIFSVLREV